MKTVTKKRAKAMLIDVAISTAATLTAEYFLRKKIKSETFHTLVTPTVMQWGLEWIQLKKTGQTIGYRKEGLRLEQVDGSPVTSSQILKRIIYRDTLSGFQYLGNRVTFEEEDGQQFPHDRYAGTIVREVH